MTAQTDRSTPRAPDLATDAAAQLRLGDDFRRLWFARATSDAGSAIASGALPLIAIRTLDASTLQVSLLTAVAGLVGAAVAVPLGPFVEARRKRPTMIATDLVRALLFASVPVAGALDILTFWQLVAVSAIGALGTIIFGGASTAHLKSLVPPPRRTEAIGKLESTFWLFNTIGPALGGAIIHLLGTTATLAVQALGLLASALGIHRIQQPEPDPPQRGNRHFLAETSAGFTVILAHPTLRPLLANATLFSAFMAWIAPLELVLLLRELALPAWQFGLALALPCLGGIAGSWFAPRLTRRFGEHRTLVVSALLRGLPLLALPFLPVGVAGVVVYVVVMFALLFLAGVFRPVYSALRMEVTEDAYMTRVITAFTLSARGLAPLFALFGGLVATWIGVRGGLLVGVIGLIASGIFLPWRTPARRGEGRATGPR